MAQAISFHNTIDNVRAYQSLTPAGNWGYISPIITIRNRSLTYQFFPHFHPYVRDLIQRLNEGGFAEFEQSDTLYLPQPNPPSGQPFQPLNVIPGSTRATLLADTSGQRPNGGAIVALTAGTPLTLPDGTLVTVKAGTNVGHPDGSITPLGADTQFPLPGFLPVSFSSGIQNISGAGAFIVLDSTPVAITLPANLNAVLTSDGSPVQLPAGTQVAIRSGLPLPYFFKDDFQPRYSPANSVQEPYPVKNIDFSTSGAYALYNWELFFHAPLLIAIHLSQNQKFQDAQNWFHYIFNPTDNSPGPTPERFWKVAPFQYTDVESIEQILINLSQPQDPQLYKDTVNSIAAWQQNPFQPWLVARYRPTAYMLKTVMAYLDNLIAWGDTLFQQYTIETINEATQLYVLAANILGPKPQAVPEKGSVKALTYNDLRNAQIDPFGNAMVDMEVDIPFDITPPLGGGTNPNGGQILPSIGKTLYFCVPRNDMLLRYWNTVADRLFKIHNSLNLQGVFQRPPLYDPPIDPALLVRATAAGLDVSSIVSGLNQPLPLVRFQFLVSKASEICQEVKSLGGNLLSAIEKRDNESISLLRAQQENAILALTNVVKYAQLQEAQKATQALQASLNTAIQRYGYYQKLLGRTDAQIQSSLPQLDALDLGSLENLNFSQSASTSEPQMALDAINPNISQDATSVSDGEIKTLTNHEVEELNKLLNAHIAQLTASGIEALGAILALIPQFGGHVQPMGCGATIKFGGDNLSFNTSQLASVARAVAEQFSFEASKAAKLGSYSRRELEWTFQSNSAKSDISQIFKQLRGAQIREAIAKKEYDNFQVQMANAQRIVDFLQGNDIGPTVPAKETTIGFYALLKRDTKALYANAFQLAFEVAKKAERALQNELGDSSLSFIQFNYLDGNEGLLAGEKLLFDVKTMDMAYADLNQREYEMTKHVSLRLVDPRALLQFRATGSCIFTMPEELFDMDCPSHYFRRIRSVAVTVPCVAGPYTSVNCTLSLQSSSIRISTDPGKSYARQGSDDPRFNDYYGTVQSIVTSSAQSDSGLFETNLKDERYLPFEGSGVAGSQWRISLPLDIPQFPPDTITDVIVHVRYTAREGGDLLKAAAIQNLTNRINNHQTVGSVCLFSIRHDFPTEWAKFQTNSILSLAFTPELYPFWSQGRNIGVKAVEFFAEMSAPKTTVTITDKNGKQDTLTANPAMGGLLEGILNNIPLPPAVADPALALTFDSNAMNDLWIAITWGKA
jgi:Tc toxin complex TcA C-terminal TcB-binding domain